jgi:hypothetical protein
MHFDWAWKTLFNRDWKTPISRPTAAATVPEGEVHVLDRIRFVKKREARSEKSNFTSGPLPSGLTNFHFHF